MSSGLGGGGGFGGVDKAGEGRAPVFRLPARSTIESQEADPQVRLVAVTALGQLGEVADAPLAELAASDDRMLSAVANSLVARRTRA